MQFPQVHLSKTVGTARATPAKQYDRAYFDRWYRHAGARVATRADVARKAHMVLGVAEMLLQRPVRSVLDVGCGEGAWRAVLRAARPRVRYVGVDSSEYVLARFGARRGIRAGTFGSLAAIERSLRGPFDVIVCCDVLQYVVPGDLAPGLGAIARLLGGVAYLEAYTTADDMVGDRRGWHHRSAGFYRRRFGAAGLSGVGMQCWVGGGVEGRTVALERTS